MRCRRSGKVMHRTEYAAAAARKLTKGANLNIYHCSSCQHFHLGHASRSDGDYDRQARFDRLLGKGQHREQESRIVRGGSRAEA